MRVYSSAFSPSSAQGCSVSGVAQAFSTVSTTASIYRADSPLAVAAHPCCRCRTDAGTSGVVAWCPGGDAGVAPLDNGRSTVLNQTTALALAAIVTFGLLASIDHLAAREAVSPVWACAVGADRA